ncbi:LysR family transcriptional regulator [Dechloromonas sp.]|uniref:LysR family transcriptional regulator n=1 Tax=Dechloromonas sp. TaxID=1917218 RepID=UPI0011F43DC1|nr:LysR family transcriptional regulator [Dechloromonas sp.]MBU3695202.1 LysR family transcriptional regulator [Dechloromonas sp.]TEX47703.1 MAG: LysR family transcriptional regulator [Rhodocyclaceae bacterium]
MRYDLPDLRLVAAISDSGSLTRAAEAVHLAPSSASHRLTQLEAALGVPLFARHARGLTPTAAGESLLRHARQVFAQLEQMHADLAPYASGLASQVTLFANTNAINCFLPEDLGDFLREHPQVRISLEEQPSPAIIGAVAAGQVEIGVVAAESGTAGLETRPYRQDRLVIIVAPGHPLAARQQLAFAEVLAEPFVCLHAGSAIHTFMMNHAARLGGRLDVRIQVRGFNAVCRMVAAGVGIGMVPRSAVTAEVVTVEIADAWAPRDLQLCVRALASLTPVAAALFGHLAAKGAAVA